jgi:hypothetical protein
MLMLKPPTVMNAHPSNPFLISMEALHKACQVTLLNIPTKAFKHLVSTHLSRLFFSRGFWQKFNRSKKDRLNSESKSCVKAKR